MANTTYRVVLNRRQPYGATSATVFDRGTALALARHYWHKAEDGQAVQIFTPEDSRDGPDWSWTKGQRPTPFNEPEAADHPVITDPAARAVIVDVLCGQALADHLGDVRDEEDHLWKLLGIPELPDDHPAFDSDSAFVRTKGRLDNANEPPPSHLAEGWDDEDDDEDD